MNVVAFDPWTAGVVFAGGDNSGIYRSIDCGQTWAPANPGIADTRLLEVAAIAFSPTVPERSTRASAPRCRRRIARVDRRRPHLEAPFAVPGFSGGVNTGVLRPPRHPSEIDRDPDPDRWRSRSPYVASFDGGVMRSTDDGATWKTLGLAGSTCGHSRSTPPARTSSTPRRTVTASGRRRRPSARRHVREVAASPATVEDMAFVGADLTRPVRMGCSAPRMGAPRGHPWGWVSCRRARSVPQERFRRGSR